jgi:predicted TPR repeat methyltransferase
VAARRGVYDTLEEGDLLDALTREAAAWDLILAADVMIYFGDLARLFQGAAQALRPGGLFAFTVERGPDDGWELSSRGRFQHGATYLRNEAARCGLAVRHLAVVGELRRERNAPVEGFAAALERA